MFQIPLATLRSPFHRPAMNRKKTLALPLITALAAATAAPAGAQVAMQLSSVKSYRQDKDSIDFDGGRFGINLTDGSVQSIAGCNWNHYDPPGVFANLCAGGTSGFLTSGEIDGADIINPYLLVTAVIPSVIIEPRRPELAILNSAPASTLPRPQGGFIDSSASLFYNLHQAAGIREYILTEYSWGRNYTAAERGRFEDEIVPGVYHYSFPRLNNPQLAAAITPVIYPMTEGRYERNNKKEGFLYTQVNKNKWVKGGYVELSYRRPNGIEWTQLSPSNTFAAVDDLYISLRELQNRNNPDSPAVRGRAIFPAFEATGDPRILLRNAFVSKFTAPPILPSSTKGVIELELQRNFQTGAVTYDFSNRKFQIPFVVVDRYSEYKGIIFAKDKKSSRSGLLKDPDKDGFNNLTEWVLDSNGDDAGSVPVQPTPELVVDYFDFFFGIVQDSFFGFTIDKKMGTVPNVKYILQRSTDGGQTWTRFRDGYYLMDGTFLTEEQYNQAPVFFDIAWRVETVKYLQAGARHSEIRVRSFQFEDEFGVDPVMPPGFENHQYRVKIVTKGKKKKK